MTDNPGVTQNSQTFKPLSVASPDDGFAAALGPMIQQRLLALLEQHGGWLPFDAFMACALYEPGLGYYANGRTTFGLMPQGQAGQGAGSDFVTAPELSPLFGATVARQVAQALDATGVNEVWEFGAGTGALAAQVLQALDEWQPQRRVTYTVVELSGVLRARQQARLAPWGDRVRWLDAWPTPQSDRIQAVVLGNEVLDAMPVKLLSRAAGHWHERGVVWQPEAQAWQWADQPTELRPPVEVAGAHDYVTEIHPQAHGFVRTVLSHIDRGAALWLDYGFDEAQYYHPQRHMGTLACHHLHRMDADPLTHLGHKDITAHVNFTGVALAAQDVGWAVGGYTSQGRFLLNAGLPELLDALPQDSAGVAQRAMASKLIHEHEMGELFKAMLLVPEQPAMDWEPLGFSKGDRTHVL